MRVCVVPSNMLKYPRGGGHAWCFLNWALGLQAVGCQVTWALRFLRDWWSPGEMLDQLRYLISYANESG